MGLTTHNCQRATHRIWTYHKFTCIRRDNELKPWSIITLATHWRLDWQTVITDTADVSPFFEELLLVYDYKLPSIYIEDVTENVSAKCCWFSKGLFQIWKDGFSGITIGATSSRLISEFSKSHISGMPTTDWNLFGCLS